MNRQAALDALVREAITIVSVAHAQEVARAFGETLDGIGCPPRPLRELAAEAVLDRERDFVMSIPDGDRPAVSMGELAWRLALRRELYTNADHATGSPYSSGQKHLLFVAHRAAIRLAWSQGGRASVDALRERNRHIPRRMFEEAITLGDGRVVGRMLDRAIDG